MCIFCSINIIFFFFFKQKTAYEMLRSLVGSEMCIRDRLQNGTQVLVFSDNAKNALYGPATTKGWLIPTYDYAWSTSTDAVRASQLDCDAATGTKTSGKLGIMNHVLETAVAVMGTARELNKQANLTSQVQMCTANPNFLSVAFARLGDLVDVLSLIHI
eukprot:TRINITY_DN21815_c0_g1_i2.p1 TRINITY_DN21815_c0_g1~~TRINITY_DN21815_c0_g1_i2.p1  ORF type:complete len:159 (+),score=36.95 TRINITY_DN21815_c0_g1_i2:66-542(+)